MNSLPLPRLLGPIFSFLLFWNFCHTATAQLNWPNAAFLNRGAIEGGVALKDGSYFSVAKSNNLLGEQVYRVLPNGRALPGHAYAIPHLPTHITYDSAHNRIFCVNFWSINSFGFLRSTIDSASPEQINNYVWRNMQVYCYDTSGTLLWTKRMQPGLDTVGHFSNMVLDGKGGVYVGTYYSGNIRSAIGPSSRVGPGKFEVAHLGPAGNVKWTRYWKEPRDSAVGALGVHLLVARPLGGVESIKILTDTGTGYQPNPGGQIIHLHRLDSSGNLLQARTAVFKGRGMMDQSGPYLEFMPHRINGQLRYYYLAPNYQGNWLTEGASNILEFDSTLTFKRAFLLPRGVGTAVNSNLASFPNGRLGFSGTRYDYDPITNISSAYRDFLFLDPTDFDVKAWHVYNALCNGANEVVPTAFPILRRNPNGSRAYDMLALVSSGDISKGTTGLFRFKDGLEKTCHPKMQKNPNPVLGECTSLYGMEMRAGSKLQTRVGNSLNWTTITPFGGLIPLSNPKLVSLCDTIQEPLGPITVCDTTVQISLVYQNEDPQTLPDRALINGLPVFKLDSIRFTSSGTYIIERWDTCRLFPPLKDTLVVKLGANVLQLSTDTLGLCPGEEATVSSVSQPGTLISWQAIANIPPFNGPIRTFTGGTPGAGTFPIVVMSAMPDGQCPAFDTLVFVSKAPVLATLNVSQPKDSLITINGNVRPFPAWTINGGNPLYSNRNLDVKPQWGPFFEGQYAKVIVNSMDGCPDTLYYFRTKSPDPEPVDSTILPFEFPNLVTKDGNGANDRFEIRNQQPEDIVDIAFYDRWGIKRYDSSAYLSQFPPQDVPAGVYFWTAKIAFFRNRTQFLKDYSGWLQVVAP